VTIADLDEAQLALGFLFSNFQTPAQAIRLEHAAPNHAQGPGPGPGHAFEKTTAVDAIVIVVV
jgi:hypothetical protein